MTARVAPILPVLFAAAVAAAQEPPQRPPQNPEQGVTTWPPRADMPLVNDPDRPDRMRLLPSGYPGLDVVAPSFEGFPLYSPQAPGFGGYPGYPGFSPEGAQALGEDLRSRRLPEATPRPAGLWPSWVIGGAADERSAVDQVLVVRHADRVWLRDADDAEVWVPLEFWDKFRRMRAGSGVQVRSGPGRFSLLLAEGATLHNVGPAHLEFDRLAAELVELSVIDHRQLWVDARTRLLRLRLPDGSSIELQGTSVQLAREVDGDRCAVRNLGPGPLQVRSPLGDVTVPRGHTVDLLLATPIAPDQSPSTLGTDGTVRVAVDGQRLDISGGGEGGSVRWLGARIGVAAGASVRIDALAGERFPEYRRDAGTPPAAR